jgi:hypothetical protein
MTNDEKIERLMRQLGMRGKERIQATAELRQRATEPGGQAYLNKLCGAIDTDAHAEAASDRRYSTLTGKIASVGASMTPEGGYKAGGGPWVSCTRCGHRFPDDEINSLCGECRSA